jgi:hypothetical protein
MRYLPIFSLGLLDASVVIGASVLLNVELCIRKLESVRTRLKGITRRARSYSITPLENDVVGLTMPKRGRTDWRDIRWPIIVRGATKGGKAQKCGNGQTHTVNPQKGTQTWL